MKSRIAVIERELARVNGQPPLPSNPLPKYLKMAANPFRFLRGAAQLFYADIQTGSLTLPEALCSSIPLTMTIGDCHVSNFGFITEEGYAGDRVVFAPNDFDDACVGRAVWDLSRFCVSLILAAEYGRGIVEGRYLSREVDSAEGLAAASEQEALTAAAKFLNSYLETCQKLCGEPDYRQATSRIEEEYFLAKYRKKARRRAAAGEHFSTKSSLAKAVAIDQRPLAFRSRPERYKRLPLNRQEQIESTFRPYVDDEILDVVERLGAGTGSMNMLRFYLLVGPADYRGLQDLPLCHIVEIKQQRSAAPLHYFPDISPVNRLDPAHLTVDCQRRMQRNPDLVLDDTVWEGAHWLVRSRHHARVDFDPEDICLSKKNRAGEKLSQYAQVCGQALALAHSRGDRRSTRFEAAIAAHLPASMEALIDTSVRYAAQTAQDCLLLSQLLADPNRSEPQHSGVRH